ncbi:MAG: phage terminase large subunit, partial [Campylobacter sp.]|nr:phage terminase large subunit [Campylobacter sp.]
MLIQNFNFFIIKTNSLNIENLSFGGVGGSGKTYSLTQFLTYKAITEKCRILCLREFSNSNKSSLVSEFKNFIYENDLEAQFKDRLTLTKKELAIKILVTEIMFKHNGSQILFAGINDNTAMNLKSISNINYCWVEESDFLTEYAYNILKPTIRAKNSKLFYTFNP